MEVEGNKGKEFLALVISAVPELQGYITISATFWPTQAY